MARTGSQPLLLLALGLLLLVSVANCEFARTVYTSTLSNTGAIPSVGPQDSFGVGICFYNRNSDPKEMDCSVQHNIDFKYKTIEASVFVNVGGAYVDLYQLASNDTTPLFRGQFGLVEMEVAGLGTYTVAQQEEDFLNGLWGIEISTDTYQSGEIVGFLVQTDRFFAILEGDNVVPEVDTIATGLAIGSFTNQPSKSANFRAVHSVLSPTSAIIGSGDRNEVGFTRHAFISPQSPIIEDVIYSSATRNDIFDGEQFIEVFSADHRLGEVRGQWNTVDYLPPVSFTARLDGTSVQPSDVLTLARGSALFSVNCDTRLVEYIVVHNVADATEAFLGGGNPDETGNMLFALPRGESPIYGQAIFSQELIVAFYKAKLFVSVQSVLYPNGEIRGQLTDRHNYYAYLSGSNVVPPISSSGVGVATLRFGEDTPEGRVLDYWIHFSLPANVEQYTVELLSGEEGSQGTSQVVFAGSASPVMGVDVLLSGSQVNHMGSESMFLRVGPASTFGQTEYLRGQVLHIRNPCPIITDGRDDDSADSSFPPYLLQSSFEFNGASAFAPSMALAVVLGALALLW